MLIDCPGCHRHQPINANTRQGRIDRAQLICAFLVARMVTRQ